MIEESYRLLCDICERPASYQDTWPTRNLAREGAVEAGWQTRLTHMQDLCPYCQEHCV